MMLKGPNLPSDASVELIRLRPMDIRKGPAPQESIAP